MRRKTLVISAAVAAFAAAGVAALYRFDLARARARLAGKARSLETRWGRLEYAIEGQGTPLLVIHGASGGFDQALDMTGALAGKGFRLIAPSRFGYLGSERPAGLTVASQADAYDELLHALDVEQAIVVAVSAGAWSALEFAIRHPDRCKALVLLVPAARLPAGTEMHGGAFARAVFGSDFVAWAAIRLSGLFPGLMARQMLGVDPEVLADASPEERRRVRTLVNHLLPMRPRRKGTRFDVETAHKAGSFPLERIACPVLAISADDDLFHTAARARRIGTAAPDGQCVIYRSGGHVLVGRYAEALGEVSRFLKEAQTA
ncbi:MAG TPA: alpha/beta hydrolase [Caulobacteraceae bacterium]|nr:alpha/beta hydrolase [Caulobacteraceae bacterium]